MYPEKRQQYRGGDREVDYVPMAFCSAIGVLLVALVYLSYRLVTG